MIGSRTEVIRVSRELVDGSERFSVQCVPDGHEPEEHRHHFAGVPHLRSWLTLQRLLADEDVDVLVARLRQFTLATPH